MTLGAIVAARRKRLGYSQEELGRLAKVSREQISKIENDRAKSPSWGDLMNIAQSLMLPPRDLLVAAGYRIDGQNLPAERSIVDVLRQALAIAEAQEIERQRSREDSDEEVSSGAWGYDRARTPVFAGR